MGNCCINFENKHQTLCLAFQLQAASSRATSTDRLHGYPTGYYYEGNASSVAQNSPSPVGSPYLLAPNPVANRSEGQVHCWTSRDSFAAHLVPVYCVHLPPPTIAPFYPAHLRQLDFVNVLVCLASALITNTSPCPLYTALLRSASSGTPDRSRRPPAKPRIAPYSPEPPLLHWPPHPSVHCLIPRSPPDCH